MQNNTEEESKPGNAFALIFGQIAHGDLAGQASETLAEMVKAVHETNKKGKITLTLEIKPRGRDAGQVELSGEVKPSFPIPDIAPSMFFATEDGELKRENPRQRQLPFGEQDDTKPKQVSNQ